MNLSPSDMALEAGYDDEKSYSLGMADERRAIVAYLRSGGDTVRGVWYSWDSEMRGYYASLANRIEDGNHHN